MWLGVWKGVKTVGGWMDGWVGGFAFLCICTYRYIHMNVNLDYQNPSVQVGAKKNLYTWPNVAGGPLVFIYSHMHMAAKHVCGLLDC